MLRSAACGGYLVDTGRTAAVALDPGRRVHLSGDRTRWIAPHNDPVFAEPNKCPFSHEMPVVYATRLCEKWLDAIVEGAEYAPSRDGQGGGVPIDMGGMLRMATSIRSERMGVHGRSGFPKPPIRMIATSSLSVFHRAGTVRICFETASKSQAS